MKSAVDIAYAITSQSTMQQRTDTIRAAQIEAFECAREEAAKVAETGKGWGKMFPLTPAPCTDAAAKAIRAIEFPGETK